MILYYAEITDIQGMPVMKLELTATAKHSAFLATKFIDYCPPAMGFNIRKMILKPNIIANMLNDNAKQNRN